MINVADGISLTLEEERLARFNRALHQEDVLTDGRNAGQRRYKTQHQAHYVSRRDFHTALRFLDPLWAPRLKLLVCTGARPSEWPALSRPCVDYERQTIEIRTSLSRRGVELPGDKNTHHLRADACGRTTILPRFLLGELDATGVPLSRRWVTAPEGGLLQLSNFRTRILSPAMRQAEDLVPGFQLWTLKDLRHTFATELLGAGIPVTHVAHWMGDQVRVEDGSGNRRRLRSRVVEIYDHPTDAHVAEAANVMAAYASSSDLELAGVR